MRAWAGIVSCVVAAVAVGQLPKASPPPLVEMEAAAKAFLDELDTQQRERAVLPMDDANRLDWHYVPRRRKGISFGELSDAQRIRVHGLLRSALSARGYLKVQGVLLLEAVLFELESRPGRPADHRDPGHYYVTVFGTPGDGRPWGWRLEGHHLSLNFSSATRELAATPLFLGANPAEVQRGSLAGLRVLGEEERLARELVESFDDDQRRLAVRDGAPPSEILFGPGSDLSDLEPAGLPAAQMNPHQRGLFRRLLDEYIGNVREDLAEALPSRIEQDDFGNVHFLWLGDVEAERFYYRIQGSRFVIEYDVVRDNHVHTVWRDAGNDFGRDILRRHHEHSH